MNRDEVLKLAKLARIEISDAEAESLSHEFEAILKYVGEVKGAVTVGEKSTDPKDYPLRNVFREDTNSHDPGIYTEKILTNAPAREGEYIKVKKIL